MDQKFDQKYKFLDFFNLFIIYLFSRGFVAAVVAFHGTQSNQQRINRDVQWYFHAVLFGFVLSWDLENKDSMLR